MKESSIDWSRRVQRESVRIEWKENVADERGVVKTLCAFANDIQKGRERGQANEIFHSYK